MKPRIELFRGGVLRKQWYFRFVAGNGEVVAQSEGYRNRGDARASADLVVKLFATAEIVEKP